MYARHPLGVMGVHPYATPIAYPPQHIALYGQAGHHLMMAQNVPMTSNGCDDPDCQGCVNN